MKNLDYQIGLETIDGIIGELRDAYAEYGLDSILKRIEHWENIRIDQIKKKIRKTVEFLIQFEEFNI